jgi:type II secretory pathway pseudopilin PulG
MDNYRQSDQPTNHQEAGYTILEAIIAILIVTVLMSVVAPVIGFSVGTRVSAKRTELASQAARSYIDWVRVDPANRAPGRTTTSTLKDANAPSITALNTDCLTGNYCDTSRNLYCVDGDGDGKCTKTSLKDMIVQAVSYNKNWQSTVLSSDYAQGYQLGIKVYRADAFQGPEPLKKVASDTTTTSTTNINSAGGNRTVPLIAIVTEIPPTINSLQNLKNRITAP